MALNISFDRDTFGSSDRLVGRVVYTRTLSYDRFIVEASDGGQSRELELRTAMYVLRRELIRLLASGERVKTPIGVFGLGLRPPDRALEHHGRKNSIGKGDGSVYAVDPGRLRLTFRADRSLMQAVRGAVRLERVATRRGLLPAIECVRSLERVDDEATVVAAIAGELYEVHGARLAFERANEDVGVFFVPAAADGPRDSVRASAYGNCSGTRTVFRMPTLDRGRWRLVVRTRPTAARVREGAWSGDLVVEP